MKFKQFLQESPFKTSDWVEENEIKAYDRSHNRITSSLKWISDDNKHLSRDVDGVIMFAKKHNQEFNWLLDRASLSYLELRGAEVEYGYVIKDFAVMPHPVRLSIHYNSTIKSFKGIETVNLDYLRLGYAVKIECGMLRLLKHSSLRRILKIEDDGLSPNPDLLRAIEIINKYLEDGDRDIIKCQNELIDEDLEEFAKL